MGFALSEMQLSSTSFENRGAIPSQFTGEGDDISPALSWNNVPEGTQSFAIICHDPDAPKVAAAGDSDGNSVGNYAGNYGFVHWVLYNIPASVTELKAGEKSFTEGSNDFGNNGYGGPMPPEGHGTHHYFFWVFALDTAPNLKEGYDLWSLLGVIEPHVLGMNRLVGTYSRG